MAREDLFWLVLEPSRWPSFYNNLVAVKEGFRFVEPGDQVGFEYRVLGRLVDAEAVLTAADPPTTVELETRIPGALTSRQRWGFQSEGTATLVSARLDVADVTDWFGVPVDRYVVARALYGDLSRTLDNLDDLVASGLV